MKTIVGELMKTALSGGPGFRRTALVVVAALALIGPAAVRAQATQDPLAAFTAALYKDELSKEGKDKFWEMLTKIFGLAAAIPTAAGGVAYLANYLNGRGRLVRDRQIFESQKVTLDLIEQIVRIEGLKKTAESPLSEQKISEAYDYTIQDFYRTLIALRANVQLRGAAHARARVLPAPDLKFREIRKLPAWRRYFVVPRPRTPLEMLVTALYYYLALVVGAAAIVLIALMVSTSKGPDALHDPGFTIVMVLLLIVLPVFLSILLLGWIWSQLFNLRETYEARVGHARDMAAAMDLAPAATSA